MYRDVYIMSKKYFPVLYSVHTEELDKPLSGHKALYFCLQESERFPTKRDPQLKVMAFIE